MAAIQQFLNTRLPSLDALATVDATIAEISGSEVQAQSETSAENHNHNDNDNDTSLAISVLDTLRSCVRTPSVQAMQEIDTLIDQYGPIPALTYARILVVKKHELQLRLDVERQYLHLLSSIQQIGTTSSTNTNICTDVQSLRAELDAFSEQHRHTTLKTIPLTDFDVIALIDHLYTLLYGTVKSLIRPQLQETLQMKVKSWETMDVDVAAQIDAFTKLLQLQLSAAPPSLVIDDTDTIWAIDALVVEFQKKFKFHFLGKGETNRLDKPEFAFSYVSGYLSENLQRAQDMFATPFASKVANATTVPASFSTCFITSLLPMLRMKFSKEITMLLDMRNGHLLSHFVSEVKKFDALLIQKFAYCPTEGQEWTGLTKELVLSRDEVWSIWLSNEKQFVNDRFDEIVSMEDAFSIESDVVELGRTKPTKSSLNLKNLLEGITASYDSLPLKYQMRFLSEVQLKLLNFYFDTLKNGLSALRGIKNVHVDGVSTLERICRVWCSAKYMIEVMQMWSNELTFIELWNSLVDNDRDAGSLDSKGYEITFFESVINGYRDDILRKVPTLVKGYIERQLNRTMKDYFQTNRSWSHVQVDTESEKEHEGMADLNSAISTLNKDLRYLKATVSTATYYEWKLMISDTVASYFEKNIALANSFSRSGAEKLQLHLDHVFHRVGLVMAVDGGYGHACAVVQVLQTGQIDEQWPSIDDATLATLLIRRV
jgi:hypothetical protein